MPTEVKLKAGGMGLISETGTPTAFIDSMASAIEEELNTLLAAEGKPTLPLDNSTETRDRRMLFVAIARGVVKHLAARQDALVVHLQFTDGVLTGATIEIKSE